MKKNIVLVSLLILNAFSCASKPNRQTAQSVDSEASDNQPTSANDCGGLKPNDLTIWTLQKMANDKKIDTLNCLFNHKSIAITKLPVGYAAGTAARVFDRPILSGPTGFAWKGKIFFPSEDPTISKGLNRIRHHLGRYKPTASFVTKLVPSHALVEGQIDSGKPIVVLNYTDPVSEKNYAVEGLLKKIQVYDLMVPVPGKNGDIYIGKTWRGQYNKKTKVFNVYNPDELTAWFFLDFSQAALNEQEDRQVDKSEDEVYIKVLPIIKKEQIQQMNYNY